MKTVLVGLPLFTKKLTSRLSQFDKKNTYIRLDTYYNKWDKLRALWHIPRADCLFSINGTITQSKTFDLALKHNVPIMVLWAGTDVTNAIKAYKSGKFNQKYIEKIHHFCEAPWLQEELKSVGINAQILHCATATIYHHLTKPKSNQLTILGYIPKKRADFYGIKAFLNAAKQFPKIKFLLAGAEAEDFDSLPTNIEALGWVGDMNVIYDRSHAIMRFVEHDGLSNVVRESLGRGKQILYTYPLNHCIHCPSEDILSQKIQSLQEKFEKGEDLTNYQGYKYIENTFNEKKVLSNLVKKIKEISLTTKTN